MNSITFTGRLGKDSELKYSANGMAFLKFEVADKHDKENTNWWNCTMFGKRAEALAEMLNKGSQVSVIGKIKQEKKDEKTYYNVIVNDIELLGSKKDAPTVAPTKSTPSDISGINLDDLPF